MGRLRGRIEGEGQGPATSQQVKHVRNGLGRSWDTSCCSCSSCSSGSSSCWSLWRRLDLSLSLLCRWLLLIVSLGLHGFQLISQGGHLLLEYLLLLLGLLLLLLLLILLLLLLLLLLGGRRSKRSPEHI